jgi:hypothetical protein
MLRIVILRSVINIILFIKIRSWPYVYVRFFGDPNKTNQRWSCFLKYMTTVGIRLNNPNPIFDRTFFNRKHVEVITKSVRFII